MSQSQWDEETDALLALDALLPGEQADAELRVGTVPVHTAAAALLAEDTVADPPAELRAETLLRATSGRRPGRPVDAAQPCEPAVAFDRTVEDLRDLLDSLTDAEWDAPAHPDHGRVRDLVAHLVGVERLVLRWLAEDAEDPVPELPDHIAATRPVVAELADTEPREIARQWYAGARAVAAAAGDGNRPVVFHDVTITVDQLLVTRTGELWAHAIDICHAAGRPVPELDLERMTTFCTALMAAVPLAMAYGGTPVPGRAACFVLTGPAGGTYTVPLAPQTPAGDPDVMIVTDAVRLCRLAVRRLRPEQLDAVVDGDRALADLVLGGLGALARD